MEQITRPQNPSADTKPTRFRDFDWVRFPRDFSISPIFAATKQKGPRKVIVGDRCFQIGGIVDPLRPDDEPPPGSIIPGAFDTGHAALLLALLAHHKKDETSRDIAISISEVCRILAHANGGRFTRDVCRRLSEFLVSWIRVITISTGESHIYRLIERVHIEHRIPRRKDSLLAKSKQMELHIHSCTLSAEFFAILNRIDELQHLRLDVFTSIRSPLAKAIYLYIPSRAHHHTEGAPFEITVTNLLQQVSYPIPAQKCRRRQLFTQNKNSILKQLDGKETLTGVFRVRLVATKGGDDWKLQTWVERNSSKLRRDPANSKLITLFLANGHTESELEYRLDSMERLDDYEVDALEKANIDIAKNRRFLELAKALLGRSRFAGIVSECKADELEGRKAIKSSMARLIWRVMEKLREKPALLAPNNAFTSGTELRDLLQKRDIAVAASRVD